MKWVLIISGTTITFVLTLAWYVLRIAKRALRDWYGD